MLCNKLPINIKTAEMATSRLMNFHVFVNKNYNTKQMLVHFAKNPRDLDYSIARTNRKIRKCFPRDGFENDFRNDPKFDTLRSGVEIITYFQA